MNQSSRNRLLALAAVGLLQITVVVMVPAGGTIQEAKCGVSGGGRSCPQKNTTTFNY